MSEDRNKHGGSQSDGAEHIDGQLPQLTDVIDPEVFKKLKKQMKESLSTKWVIISDSVLPTIVRYFSIILEILNASHVKEISMIHIQCQVTGVKQDVYHVPSSIT